MKLLAVAIGLACVLPAFSQQELKTTNPFLRTNDINRKAAPNLSKNPFLPNIPPVARPKILGERIEETPTTNPFLVGPTTQDDSAKSCRGPDYRSGVCRPLAECPPLANALLQNRSNATFIDYLKKSNVICGNGYSVICCPLTKQNLQLVDEIPTRLPTVEDGCGRVVREKNLSTLQRNTFHIQVVGGISSMIRAWPWIALLGYDDGISTAPFKCGGALITNRHVLTAAHCIRSDLTFVRLGEHDLSTDTEAQHIDVPIRKSLRHPRYNRTDGRNDIALLYLSQPVSFSDTISPVCLPTTPELRTKSYVNHSPYVAGWGRTLEGGKTATVLQELQIPIHDNSVCVDLYTKQKLLISQEQFDDSIICAGVLAGGKDTCQGDSGGPLMVPEVSKLESRFYMIGVVSYSIGCARPDVLGAYTRVASFIDWIRTGVTDTT